MKDLTKLSIKELRGLCKEYGIKNYANFKKAEYIARIEEAMKPAEVVEEEIKEDKPEDLIGIVEIANKYFMTPKKARRILRKLEIERPYKRWEWSRKDHKEIIELVENIIKRA